MIIKFEGVSEKGLKTIREFINSPENVLRPSEIIKKRVARKPYLREDFEGITFPEQLPFAKELRSRKGPEITLELQEDFRPEGSKAFVHRFDAPRIYLRRLMRAIGPHRRAIIKCRMSAWWWTYAVGALKDGDMAVWHTDLRGPFTNFDIASGGVFYARFLRLHFRRSRDCECIIETHGAVCEGWLAESDYDGGDWHDAPPRFMYRLMTALNKFKPSSCVP